MAENLRPARPRVRFGDAAGDEWTPLPLRLVVLAPLSADAGRGASRHRLIRVDKDSFVDALHQICPEVRLELPNREGTSPLAIEARIPVESLKSFQPAAVMAGWDSLRGLRDGRKAVEDLRDRRIGLEEFRRRVSPLGLPFMAAAEGTAPETRRPAPEQAPEESPLDSILDIVETPGSIRAVPADATEGAARVRAFISEMLAPGRGDRTIDRRTADAWISEIDSAVTLKLRDVLQHEDFVRVEEAWRGLRFLVDRIDFREPVQLEVMAVDRDRLAAALEALIESEETSQVPVSAVIADFEFGVSTPELEQLRRAAELAERLQAPLLVGAGAEFFGRASMGEVARLSNPGAFLEAQQYVKWHSLREAGCSSWLGIGMNRFLLRPPYGREPAGRGEFSYQDRGRGLTGHPAWAIGSLIAGSFVRTGWCGQITGSRGGGIIENLPVRKITSPAGDEWNIPLEAVFKADRLRDFYGAGFQVLQCGEDQDFAVLVEAPTVHRPEIYGESGATESARQAATLSHQMAAARLGQYVRRAVERCGRSAGAAVLVQEIEAETRRALEASDPAAGTSLRVETVRGAAGEELIRVRVGPVPGICPTRIELELAL